MQREPGTECSWLRTVAENRSTLEAAAPKAPRISLILPALNEAEGLSVILPRLPELIDDVIVVNGPSQDRTVEVVRTLRPDAVVVQQLGRGKGNAIKHGLAVADGDMIVTMDADGSMNPEDIPAFVGALHAGADFVKGSRTLPGGGSSDFTWLRRAGNDALTRVANVVFGAAYTDITYGFNAYWSWTIRHLGRLADGFEFEIQAAIRAVVVGMRTAEVPAHEPARVGGVSKLNPFVDGAAILRVLALEASPRRAAQLGAAYEAEEGRLRGLLRARLLDPTHDQTGTERVLETV
ncbi:MAG: glycosyltransferase family 2 protein [Solirubrobacteraceae bacterium]